MPPTGPRPHGDGPGDRPGGDDPTARRRRGWGVVAATILTGLAIVLAVLLLVPRCSQTVQDSGSPVDRSPAVEEPASTAREWERPRCRATGQPAKPARSIFRW